MLRLSKLADYAFMVVTHMVFCYPKNCDSQAIARDTSLPLPTVRKVLKKLVNKGVLVSFRGIRGGYALAKEPQSISILDVINAIEGPWGITECSVGKDLCKLERSCQVRGSWQRLHQTFYQSLAEVSVGEFCVQNKRL
ncbi:MAG: SUF system Fe-S cluster assembly regulator [Gammaproteobacteria bacterium]|nr:SUF system Fe-S cluster assembly regulator [Gammaproteobacteria bacterium]